MLGNYDVFTTTAISICRSTVVSPIPSAPTNHVEASVAIYFSMPNCLVLSRSCKAEASILYCVWYLSRSAETSCGIVNRPYDLAIMRIETIIYDDKATPIRDVRTRRERPAKTARILRTISSCQVDLLLEQCSALLTLLRLKLAATQVWHDCYCLKLSSDLCSSLRIQAFITSRPS